MEGSQHDRILIGLFWIGVFVAGQVVWVGLCFFVTIGFDMGGMWGWVLFSLPLAVGCVFGIRSGGKLRWIACALISFALILMLHCAWERRGVKACYAALSAAVSEQRWSDAYLLMAPNYRDKVDLKSFVEETFEVPELGSRRTIRAYFGSGIVFPNGSRGAFDSGLGIEFERVSGRWYCSGEGHFFID